jgi:23S rRNA pseudouridine1911/1915/1917 synthase
MFGKNESVKHEIQKTWNTTVSKRTYVGVVEGQLKKAAGTITSWLQESKAFIVYSSQNPKHGHKAVTSYKVLGDNSMFSLLQLNLQTGRKHQIRVHMQEINHPIIGDKKYGSTLNPIRRMGLHAQVLEFTHPRTGKSCRFETAIPAAFQKLFSTAGK